MIYAGHFLVYIANYTSLFLFPSFQWLNNKKNGKGCFFYNNGHKYDGMWVNDLRHGRGKLTLYYDSAAEESYEGGNLIRGYT